MSELGWFLAVVGLIVAIAGGAVLATVFAWFVNHGGEVQVKPRRGARSRLAGQLAGLFVLACLLAGVIRLVRPYLH